MDSLFAGLLQNTGVSAFWIVLLMGVLFIVGREIVTWYWKLNEIIRLLEEIKDNTSKNPAIGKTDVEQQKPKHVNEPIF